MGREREKDYNFIKKQKDQNDGTSITKINENIMRKQIKNTGPVIQQKDPVATKTRQRKKQKHVSQGNRHKKKYKRKEEKQREEEESQPLVQKENGNLCPVPASNLWKRRENIFRFQSVSNRLNNLSDYFVSIT